MDNRQSAGRWFHVIAKPLEVTQAIGVPLT
jgi:hypothetical protein